MPARTSAHLRGSKRARTLASQAEIAARSAILAADEARNRRASFAAVAQSPAIENPVAPAAVADNAAAGNDPVASGPRSWSMTAALCAALPPASA